MQQYKIDQQGRFILDNRSIAVRKSIILKTPEKEILFPLKYNSNFIQASCSDYLDYSEELSEKNGLIQGSIRITVKTDSPFILQCPIQLEAAADKPYFMIPGFLYGTNHLNGPKSQAPKLAYRTQPGWPVSSAFYTRADRSTHNCVLCVSDGFVLAVNIQEKIEGHLPLPSTDPWQAAYCYNGLMLNTSAPGPDSIGFQIGYEHFPQRYSFVWKDPKTPECTEYTKGWIQNAGGKTLTAVVRYFIDTAQCIPDYGKALRVFYYAIHENPIRRADRKETMEKLSRAAIRDGWNDEQKFIYLCDNPDGRNIGDNGWTGGMQVAYPMLLTAHKLQDQDLRHKMLEYINRLCTQCINPDANLFYEEFRDGKWQVDGWWGVRENCYNWKEDKKHTAYINGQASYFLLKAYLLEQRKNPDWLKAASTVIHTAVKSQRKDGAYARFFYPQNGKAADYDGFQSCWFVPGAALLASITGDKDLRQSAQRAWEHYLGWFDTGELYGTPMDTHEAVDQEGNLAFIDACAELHALTNDPMILQGSRQGTDWEFSWKFAYNTSFTNDPLRKLQWSSCGGSITSIYNPHIHPMGNLCCPSLYYLYQQNQDPYLAQRLKDTCIWGLGAFNRYDNEFGFGLEGQATEQFFHSDGLLLPWYRPWDGGVWEAYLPWSSGCILLSCASEIPDSFFSA